MECIMICGGHLFLKCVTFAPGVYKRRFHVCFPVPETSCSKAYRVDHLAIGHYDHYSAYAPRWGHEDTRLRVCMEQPPYLFKRDPLVYDWASKEGRKLHGARAQATPSISRLS